MSLSQDDRHLFIKSTSLGSDVLGVEQFRGTEKISEPFCFTAQLLSNDDNIAPSKLVGTDVTISVGLQDGSKRYFNGYVAKLSGGLKVTRDTRAYSAEIVPWFWFLKKRAGCRIFQEKSVVDIVEAILGECPFKEYRIGSMLLNHPVRDYCVQYRETDFEFVSRLMEEEGIYYYFEHADGKHTMVLSDDISAYSACPDSLIKYNPGTSADPCIKRWDHQFQYASGQFSQTDYNFTLPTNAMNSDSKTIVDLPHISSFEVYDYPGEYDTKADGSVLSKVRMEELEVPFEQAFAHTEVGSLIVAGTFKMSEHNVDDENKEEWVITEISHFAEEPSYRSGGAEFGDDPDAEPSIFNYSNDIACIPSKVVYRPARNTPKPVINGSQTAVVVGPSGDEIYTDEFGRIKVQFHWDREGKKNETSSCWVRVASNWAGKKWGTIYIPRIGQEVVVSFLEGDPDRPLVIGSVYNGDQMPPYDLPANKTQSGTKTRSTKGGDTATFNEIRFEDLKGSEELYIHAEKDHIIIVENDEGEQVGNDQIVSVGNNQTTTVTNDRAVVVENDHTEAVKGGQTIDITKDQLVSIASNQTISVAKDRDVSVDKNQGNTIGGNNDTTVGGNDSVQVGKNHTLDVGKKASWSVGDKLDLKVTKDFTETISGKHTHSVTKEYSVSAKKIQFVADSEISFKTGSAEVVMKKNGDITIKGKNITINGSGNVVLKGSKVTAN